MKRTKNTEKIERDKSVDRGLTGRQRVAFDALRDEVKDLKQKAADDDGNKTDDLVIELEKLRGALSSKLDAVDYWKWLTWISIPFALAAGFLGQKAWTINDIAEQAALKVFESLDPETKTKIINLLVEEAKPKVDALVGEASKEIGSGKWHAIDGAKFGSGFDGVGGAIAYLPYSIHDPSKDFELADEIIPSQAREVLILFESQQGKRWKPEIRRYRVWTEESGGEKYVVQFAATSLPIPSKVDTYEFDSNAVYTNSTNMFWLPIAKKRKVYVELIGGGDQEPQPAQQNDIDKLDGMSLSVIGWR